MSDLWDRLESEEKENDSNSNISDTAQTQEPLPKPATTSSVAASPNTLRKRRREQIARKVESRKALITTACTSRLDMTKVHSILSGPRLSWDWQSGPGARHDAEDLDDDSCGLIVDFHQDSRSALKTHISKAMSQMASRDISSQSIPASAPKSSSSEEIKQIIQMKRRMISSQATQQEPVEGHEEPPLLEPISDPDFIHAWQETQLPPQSTDTSGDPVIEPTQVFIPTDRVFVPQPSPPEEEIEMESDEIGLTQVYVPAPRAVEATQVYTATPAVEPTQVYIPKPSPAVAAPARELREQISKASSIPPNSERSDSDRGSSGDESSDSSATSSSAESFESDKPAQKKAKKTTGELTFQEWLAKRQHEKQLRKQKRKKNSREEAKGFFEAEAEESEDEELAGIMRRQKSSGDEDGSSDDDDDEDSDLEDLVASAKDEFDLLQKGGKDSSRLAKLHAKWQDSRDEELQKAIEGRDFWKRKGIRGLKGLDDETGESGLNRLQRKMKARQDSFVQQYDFDGNPLAPEFASDSDYDSMEIDSDEFFDEFSDDDRDQPLNEQEVAQRRERKERDKERRRRDLELKMEMKNRRALLKAKLKEELAMKEKDTREIQAGLGIMPEEDREAFKLVNRTQGVFGYTQAASGTTTQSTSASASSQASPAFSFLAKSGMQEVKFRSRRSSVGALDLE